MYGIQVSMLQFWEFSYKLMLLLNIFRTIQAFSSGAPAGGECADPEDAEPAGLPGSPTPDTGTPRSCHWAQVLLLP